MKNKTKKLHVFMKKKEKKIANRKEKNWIFPWKNKKKVNARF